MADSKTETRPQDASRVNVNEDYEVRYWTKRFNCSKDQLVEAVNAVGVSVEKIEHYLRRK
jgi:hypothetical protein